MLKTLFGLAVFAAITLFEIALATPDPSLSSNDAAMRHQVWPDMPRIVLAQTGCSSRGACR